MNWELIYFSATCVVWLAAYYAQGPRKGRQHLFGADIALTTWLVGWAAREITGDATPLGVYAMIDTLAAFAFSVVMFRNSAAWAAVCVVLSFIMGLAHLAFYLTGQAQPLAYVVALNGLYALILLTITTGIQAGRQTWGINVDRFFAHRRRGWTFSGFRFPRAEILVE